MFGCADAVTVWNKWRDPESGKDVFIRHVLPVKCKLTAYINRSVSGNTASVASSYVLVIPYCDAYRPPEEWAALTPEERGVFFTVQKGDLVALGAHDTEITGVKPYTESMVKAALEPNAFTVKAWQDNTRAGLGGHIKVEGV